MTVCVEKQVWFGCDRCPRTGIVGGGNKQVAIKEMRESGWRIGIETLCPDCAKKVKE